MVLKQLKNYPAHLIRRAHQLSTPLFLDSCREQDIAPVQYAALVTINEHPNLAQTQLAGLIGYDRATIGKVLELMESKNWIQRCIDPASGRSKLVKITSSGNQLMRDLEPKVVALNNKLVSTLTEAEAALLLSFLQKIVDSDKK